MYKSLFLSDIHLGSAWSNSEKLFNLLENIEAEQLFLVGDIINITASKEHPDIVRFITLIQAKAWKIVYISGNHEDERVHLPAISLSFTKDFFSKENHLYRNNQATILLEHGHRFHEKNTFNKLLRQGAISFKWLTFRRKKRGLKSVSKRAVGAKKESLYHRRIKPLAQKLLRHSFKSYMFSRAKEKDCSIIICGHFHIPEDARLKNIRYLNCGDWVKNSSYIVENQRGEFFLKSI